MKQILVVVSFVLGAFSAQAQTYISSGSIEYEVKTNVHALNEGDEWFERFKDQVPKFSINYYTLQFGDNKSVYKFDRRGEAKKGFSFGLSEEENIWFNDYNNKTYATLMTLEGYLLFNGEQKKINWKLVPNDQREIAGFSCRKAQTVLFDSVYVFVYYTDNITLSGGPMNLNGLPGTILGVTVPRLHTSWIATGLKMDKPSASSLMAPTKGKKKTQQEVKTDLASLAKSWGSESKKWLDQMYWRTFL
jgi:GLPGLI family protein